MIDRAALTYRHLFPTEAVKAEAFDKIAELFYNCNFGSTSKADIETLMFSIFIERILKEDGPENFKSYSDYTLSKALCITQARVMVRLAITRMPEIGAYRCSNCFPIVFLPITIPSP